RTAGQLSGGGRAIRRYFFFFGFFFSFRIPVPFAMRSPPLVDPLRDVLRQLEASTRVPTKRKSAHDRSGLPVRGDQDLAAALAALRVGQGIPDLLDGVDPLDGGGAD